MNPRLTLAQLRMFVATAETGGFGAAAAELNMSQSTISEAVKGLERTLGYSGLSPDVRGDSVDSCGRRCPELRADGSGSSQ